MREEVNIYIYISSISHVQGDVVRQFEVKLVGKQFFAEGLASIVVVVVELQINKGEVSQANTNCYGLPCCKLRCL